MKRHIILVAALAISAMLSGCLKKIDKFNSNNITATFTNSGPGFLTADATLNPKDSIKFNYSVTSPTPIAYITVTKNSTEIARDSVKTGDHRSFSAIKKLVADTIPGNYRYRVVAYDSGGVYLGSSAYIVVTIPPDFIYYTNRKLFVPDSTAKTNKTYFNLASGTPFSYTDITAANSNNIDIGYYFDTDSVLVNKVNTAKGHTIYNLNISPVPNNIKMYDISSFTKNNTQMKLITTPTWVNINSGGIIKTTGVNNLKGTLPNSIQSLVAGNIIIFKTAAGKYGALEITYVSQNSATHGTYINFEVKIQK